MIRVPSFKDKMVQRVIIEYWKAFREILTLFACFSRPGVCESWLVVSLWLVLLVVKVLDKLSSVMGR